MDSPRRKVKDEISVDVSDYHQITGFFETENYGNGLLDTSVKVQVDGICITWKDRQRMMDELAEVIKRYLI